MKKMVLMFRKKSQKLSKAPWLPVGTFLKTENGYFYVKSKTSRASCTQRVLDSWMPHAVVNISETSTAVKALKVSGKMKFRNGSLICSQSDGKMYLVSEFKLRHIQNPDWIPDLGFTRDRAVWVSDEEMNLHEIGEPLNG